MQEEISSCVWRMERIIERRQSFLSFVVAQALGYLRNGIIKISFILCFIISLVEKGVNHFVVIPRNKRVNSIYMVMPIWLKGEL